MATKRLVRISFFTMLTVIGGLISISIPFAPTIKITFQTLFVAMSGLVLGGCDGAIAQIVYMIMGLIGLPVFSQGFGGPSYIFQPSFGYILSFPLQAFLTGFLSKRLKTLSTFKLFLCAAIGIVASYAIGISYQVMILIVYTRSTIATALATVPSVLVMLVKDIVLVYIICLIYPRIMTMIGKPDEAIKKTDEISESAPVTEPNEGEEPDEPERPKNPVPEPASIGRQ